jgi:polysaccharide biosynthesis transport protein
MKEAFMDEQFDSLRTKLEAALETPAVILVSSACIGDGESALAHGLAATFSASGYRTALIDANHLTPAMAPPTMVEDRAPASLEQVASSGPRAFARSSPDGNFSAISFVEETLRRNASRPTLSRAIKACRESYEVVIFDASPLVESNFAMMLANQADGIILAVREGRAVKRGDHELIKALGAFDLPTLGTVIISPKMIREFKAHVEQRRTAITTLSPVETQTRTRTAAV